MSSKLRDDALRIWKAGVEAVRSDRLVQDNVRVDGSELQLGDETIDLAGVRRSLWAVELPAGRYASPKLPAEQAAGGLSTYPACQAEARRLRAAGAKQLEARSAALVGGGAHGWLSRGGGAEPSPVPRDGMVCVLFGNPDVVGWLAVEDLFTVLVLVLMPAIFAEPGGRTVPVAIGLALLKVVALTGLTIVVGGRVIPWLLTQIARTQSREPNPFRSEACCSLIADLPPASAVITPLPST